MMSRKSVWITALVILLVLVKGGNSQLHLQASFKSEPEEPIQKVILSCHLNNDIEQMTATLDSTKSNNLLPGPETDRVYENVWFKLNGSVIHENTTSLKNYQVLSSRSPFAYMAQFELPQSERFTGNFSCERNITSNISVSNDVVVVYWQLLSYFEGMKMGTLYAILITLISVWVITFTMLVISCAINWKLHRNMAQKQATLKIIKGSSSQVESAISLSGITVEEIPQKSRLSSSRHQSTCTSSKHRFPDKSNVPFHFSTSGYALPACTKVSYQHCADTISLSSSCSSGMNCMTALTEDLDSQMVTKVLKYLTHSPRCSVPKCPCAHVKNTYSNLLKKKSRCSLLMEADSSNPLYASTGSQLKSNEDSNLHKITYPRLGPAADDETKVQATFIGTKTVTVDNSGGDFTFEQHGVRLRVPEGAIPPEKTIQIEIGVCLNSPLIIPSRSIPVSPIVKLCVVGDQAFQFLKPIEVELPHCLDITDKNDIELFGLQFVKARHNQFCFHETNGKANFEPQKEFGTLSTEHFCFFCITANKEIDLTKIKYRLTKIVPKDTHIASKKWKVHFCVTYFLTTCYEVSSSLYDAHCLCTLCCMNYMDFTYFLSLIFTTGIKETIQP